MVSSEDTPNPESEDEGPLVLEDLDDYVVWATEGGGVPRYLPGSDEKTGPLGLDKDRCEADLSVLRQLDGQLILLQKKGLDPGQPEVLREAAKNLKAELLTRAPRGRPKKDGKAAPERPGTLAPTTVERYLVVLRRYLRFRGVAEPKSWDLALKGPHVDRSRKLLDPKLLDAWFEVIQTGHDRRVEIATWLLLAEVPVSDLVEVKVEDIDQGSLEITRGPITRPIDPELVKLVAMLEDRRPESPVLQSWARQHHGEVTALSEPGLRSLWNDHRLLVPGSGPTMAAVLAVGRKVTVDRSTGSCVYRFSS